MNFKKNILALTLSSILCMCLFFLPSVIGGNLNFITKITAFLICKVGAIFIEIMCILAFMGSTIGGNRY